MSRSVPLGSQIPVEQDESIMTTLRVIMDVLKSHDGSIKQLQKWLDSNEESGKSRSGLEYSSVLPIHLQGQSHSAYMYVHEPPVKDGNHNEIPDDGSEVSSIVSTRTEYHELPSRSTVVNSTLSSGMASAIFPTSYVNATGALNGFYSTPMKTAASPPSKAYQARQGVLTEQPAKYDGTISSIDTEPDTLGVKGVHSMADGPVSVYQSPMKSSMLDRSSKSPNGSTLGNVSIGVLQTKIHLLEGQVAEWSDVMDEMSDRMASQPSLIRKFAKESVSDKVGHTQHNEDLASLEKRVFEKMNEKFASLDRKIVELYDDMASRVSTSPRDKDKQYARQDTAVQLSIDLESLTEQFDEHKKKLGVLEKDITEVNDTVNHVRHDVNLYRHHVTSRRGDEELVSLVAEQLLDRDEISGWKEALKETHSALNKQSEINSSLHHSYASLDKKMSSMSTAFPHYGRWRWGGVSSVYPRGHSCVDGHHADDISFVAQVGNSDPRTFAWDKNKAYIVVTSAGCYWVTIGAFGLKSGGIPPSLQVTVDEEPVALFNSCGKSPSHQRISVISSAPKHQSTTSRFRGDTALWKSGSSLAGALMLPAHSRVSICAASTTTGTRIGVEGYMELQKVY